MPQIHQRAGLGELLGSGLGQGLSSGLQQLAQHKLQEMSHRQQQLKSAQAFRDLGFGNESMALSQLPEKLQSDIIKNYWQRGGGAQTGVPEQEQAQGLAQLLSMQSPQSQQEQPESERSFSASQPVNAEQAPASVLENLLSKLGLPEKQKPVEQRLPELFGSKKPYDPVQEAIADIKQKFGPTFERDNKARAEKQLVRDQQKSDKIKSAGKQVPAALAQAIARQPSGKKPTIAEVLARPYESPEMKQAERHFNIKEERENRKQEFAEIKDALHRSEEVRKSSVRGAESARQTIHDLDRIEELSKSGKLDTPGYVEFLNRSGLDLPALMNPESEEFLKIQQGFLRDAKQYFGGRVSNYEVEQFLKTIPSLSQSPEGRQRVISNLKYIARGKLEHFKTLREVIRENKGIPPYDLEEQVFERLEPRLDKLSEKFREDINKPVPKGQNRFITALQSVAGSAAGSSGKLASKAIPAATGALVGSILGPPGTVAGGLLGAYLGGSNG